LGSFVDSAGSLASACRGFRDMRRKMLRNPRQPGRECREIRDNPSENVAESATTRAEPGTREDALAKGEAGEPSSLYRPETWVTAVRGHG
jgi:hypothetical protein